MKEKISVKTYIFKAKADEINVYRYSFTKFDPVSNIYLAKRFQCPLKLTYSMTLHTHLGMGLKAVDIDCKNATNPGLVGVVVGRALSLNDLRVMKFYPSLCRQHPEQVQSFYKTFVCSSDITNDLSSCRNKVCLSGVTVHDKTIILDSDDFFCRAGNQNCVVSYKM
jgi:hypothetical protein